MTYKVGDTIGHNLYALAIGAESDIRRENVYAAEVTCADSEEQARENGLRMALERWSTSQGWKHHYVGCTPFTVRVDSESIIEVESERPM